MISTGLRLESLHHLLKLAETSVDVTDNNGTLWNTHEIITPRELRRALARTMHGTP